MTVNELITKLKKFDGNMQVLLHSLDYDYGMDNIKDPAVYKDVDGEFVTIPFQTSLIMKIDYGKHKQISNKNKRKGDDV